MIGFVKPAIYNISGYNRLYIKAEDGIFYCDGAAARYELTLEQALERPDIYIPVDKILPYPYLET